MAPAKTLGKCGAGWVLRGEGARSNSKAFVLMLQAN